MPQQSFKKYYFFFRGETSGMSGDDVRRVVFREERAESEGRYVIQKGQKSVGSKMLGWKMLERKGLGI